MSEVEWWWNGLRRASDNYTTPRLADPERGLVRAIDAFVAAHEPEWELRVFCTGKKRGQHARAALGVIARQDKASAYEFVAALPKSRDDVGSHVLDAKHGDPVERRGDEHGDLIRWQCPRCRHNVPWTWRNAQMHAENLERHGLPELDISAIP